MVVAGGGSRKAQAGRREPEDEPEGRIYSVRQAEATDGEAEWLRGTGRQAGKEEKVLFSTNLILILTESLTDY